MQIKNINEIKEYNIICTNNNEQKECFRILQNLKLEVSNAISYVDTFIVVRYDNENKEFIFSEYAIKEYKNISFYDFKKQTKNLIPVVQDIEYNEEDGRITKINNWSSDKFIYDLKYLAKIESCNKESLVLFINLGLIFISEETRDKAKQKLIIENKLRNIASRLNNGKIDWNSFIQAKHFIAYDFEEKKLISVGSYYCKNQGAIYCLSKNFLGEAIKEIGEQELVKYFKE